MFRSRSQSSKVELPSSVMPLPRATDSSCLQSLKARAPSVVVRSGRLMALSDSQSLKAPSPISSSEAGSTSCSRAEQSLKAKLPISVSSLPISTLVRLEQPSNPWLPTLIIPWGSTMLSSPLAPANMRSGITLARVFMPSFPSTISVSLRSNSRSRQSVFCLAFCRLAMACRTRRSAPLSGPFTRSSLTWKRMLSGSCLASWPAESFTTLKLC